MDGGAWWAAVHGVTKSRTWLRGFTFTFHFHALEKEMAIHSSVLDWKIRGMGEPGGLPSMESHRVGHDWSDLAAAALAFCTSLTTFAMSVIDRGIYHHFTQNYAGYTLLCLLISCSKLAISRGWVGLYVLALQLLSKVAIGGHHKGLA